MLDLLLVDLPYELAIENTNEQVDYFKIVREHPGQGKLISKDEIHKLMEEKRLKEK